MIPKLKLLKDKIKTKLRKKSNIWSSKKIDFRRLKGHPQKYQPSVVSLVSAGITPDDAKYYTEAGLKTTGEFLGKTFYGYSKKRSDKENTLYHNLRWLLHEEHPKFHKKDKFYNTERWINKNLVTTSRPHSKLAKTMRFLNKFKKTPLIDTPLQKLRKKVWTFRMKGV